jgi:hypothetical protein
MASRKFSTMMLWNDGFVQRTVKCSSIVVLTETSRFAPFVEVNGSIVQSGEAWLRKKMSAGEGP